MPLWLIIAVAGLSALLVLWGLVQRMRGSWLRSGAWLAITLALLNPSVVAEEREQLKSIVVVVIDNSASQKLDGRAEQSEEIRKKVVERLARLNNFEVREVVVEDQISLNSDVSTALFGTLQSALHDVPPDQVAGAIFITDGQVHDIPKSAAALAIKAPVHALITGRKEERDRRMKITKAPRFGVVGEQVTLSFRVDEFGLENTRPVAVTILVDGEEHSVERVMPDIAADGRKNPDAAAVTLGTTAADDGHVLAMVGGRDFFGDGDFAKLNLASGTGRQAGSSMKPIALAGVLQRGTSVTSVWPAPTRIEIDEPQICGGRWRVRGGTGGRVSLVRATRSSLNVVYAQVMVSLRPENYVDMAERLGIGEGRLQPVCAAVLGSENVNMVEMATVFSTFSRSGTRIDPVLVTEIVNPDGTLLYQHNTQPIPVLNSSVAHQITWVLEGVITGGTGRRAQLDGGRPAAGKTGTAQLNGDATFVGYTAQRTTAVWVGFPEEVTPMSNYFNGGRVEGGTFPALIWKNVVEPAHAGLPNVDFPDPPPSSTSTTLPVVPDSVLVPDLIGRTIDEELYAELNAGYFSLSPFDRITDEFPEGQIITQVPAAGTPAPGNVLITVEIAIAPLTTAVSNVLGLPEAVARQTLTGDGFLNEVSIEKNPEPGEAGLVPGAVWAQDPAGGTDGDGVETVRIKVNPESEDEAPPEDS